MKKEKTASNTASTSTNWRWTGAAEQVILFAQMLKIAEEDHDKRTAFRYINRIGEALNRVTEEVSMWEDKAEQEKEVNHG